MKKRANKDDNKGLRLEGYIGLIGFILSLVALYFSWQANQISSQQINDNVFSPSSSLEWASYQQEKTAIDYPYYECVQRTRLANLGGANSTVIKYDVTLYFKGKSTTVSGEQERTLRTAGLENIISRFYVSFVDGEKFEVDEANRLFPIVIPAYSTVDIWTRIWFTKNADYPTDDIFYPPYDYYQFEEPGAKLGEFSPIEVSYTFTTASGKTFVTPRALCMFAK